MQILTLGIDYSTGQPLLAPREESDFAGSFLTGLQKNEAGLAEMGRWIGAAPVFRSEEERQRGPDLGDPRSAGWTYLLNAADPQRDAVIEIIRPLAELRGMADPYAPLLYDAATPDDWFDWMNDHFYSQDDLSHVPHYILIVGGPEQVPFLFQSFLDTTAAVGRVGFDRLDDLRAYVHKLLEAERAPAPLVQRQTLFFAPDFGLGDPTYYSCRFMAAPLAQQAQADLGYETQMIRRLDATRPALQEALHGARPALVFTASHGMAAPREPLEVQRQVNGAVVCQQESGQPAREAVFSAADVPADEPYLEGAVFFQFACFGYGTPAESDFLHWLDASGAPGANAPADFLGALPKKLLANPRGPLAYIGHVDLACLHGFTDPENLDLVDRWRSRLVPFRAALDSLLHLQPVGMAVAQLNERYNLLNAQLTRIYDRIRRGKQALDEPTLKTLANLFVTRTDAQNYMVFGDPGARLRVPAREGT